MASNKRAAALAAAKQKKQKMIAIGGFVVLLAVMAFTVPKTLKMLKGPQPIPDAPAQTTATTPPTAPGTPTPTPTSTPTPDVAAAELIDTGGVPEPTEGQFISFERFASKDPFAQQVGGEDATTIPPAGTPAKAKPGTAAPGTAAPGTAAPGETPSKPPSAPPSAPPASSTPNTPTTPAPTETEPNPKPTSAVISINGVRETVKVGDNFPKEEEIFELVSLTATGAKIGIAGGSLTGGAPTVTLEKGKKVTLMNTADGTQYELVLISFA
jgi:hypothetical protein